MTFPDPASRTSRVDPTSTRPRDELLAAGRQARTTMPRTALADLRLDPDRDPVAVLTAQDPLRVPELVPIRYGRMLPTPFTYFRGAAAPMAADLAAVTHTDLRVQICGDAHLANFGLFASPERRIVFDVNDFDETLPGPFEWDLKRLCASLVVAARTTGIAEDDGRAAARAAVVGYQRVLDRLSELSELEIWYAYADVEAIAPSLEEHFRDRVNRAADKARRHTSLQALAKLTEPVGDSYRIRDDPPLVHRVAEEAVHLHLHRLFAEYRVTLNDDRQRLLERYRIVDLARKVVGVGSVGTRCFILLLVGETDGSPLFLQIKEAQRSVLEGHLGQSEYHHHGQRVVAGQRLMQAASDIFLGWTESGSAHFYVRQLRDMKGSADLESMDGSSLIAYGEACGRALARGHARSGSSAALRGYLGTSERAAEALASFAAAYADQVERDHEALAAAAKSGRIPVA